MTDKGCGLLEMNGDRAICKRLLLIRGIRILVLFYHSVISGKDLRILWRISVLLYHRAAIIGNARGELALSLIYLYKILTLKILACISCSDLHIIIR